MEWVMLYRIIKPKNKIRILLTIADGVMNSSCHQLSTFDTYPKMHFEISTQIVSFYARRNSSVYVYYKPRIAIWCSLHLGNCGVWLCSFFSFGSHCYHLFLSNLMHASATAHRETISYDSVERKCAVIFCLAGTLFEHQTQIEKEMDRERKMQSSIQTLWCCRSLTHQRPLWMCRARAVRGAVRAKFNQIIVRL